MKTHAEKQSRASFSHAPPVPDALAHQAQLRSALRRAGALPRLEVGAADEPLEREADEAAQRVLRMPKPPSAVDEVPSAPTSPSPLLQMRAETSPVSPDMEADLLSLNSGGFPLQAQSRAFFEPRFGHNFGQVRLHQGDKAAQMAKALSAKAFTLGNDIVLGASSSPDDKNLMGHELAHVVQQRRKRGPIARRIQRQPSQPEEEEPTAKLSQDEERVEKEIQKVLEEYASKNQEVPREVLAALTAARKTEAIVSEHEKQVATRGVGTFYGTNSVYAQRNQKKKRSKAELATLAEDLKALAAAKKENPQLDLTATNCILFQMSPLETFLLEQEASGRLAKGKWAEIKEATKASSGKQLKNGKAEPGSNVSVGRDTVLVEQLRKKADFKTVLVDRGDTFGRRSLPKAVEAAKGVYPPKADLVQGANPKEKLDVRTGIDKIFRNTRADRAAALTYLSSLPFAILMEDYGNHTLVLSFGVIYEAHWRAGPRNRMLFERRDLSKYLASQKHLVFAVPPGYPPPD